MKIFDFDGVIPPELQLIGGKISLTDQQAKEGFFSLQWEFETGDQLKFRTPIGYQNCTLQQQDNLEYCFGMFLFGIYSEGRLHIGFECNGEEKTGFDVMLGFAGWRHILACFDRDMDGTPVNNMDCLTVTSCGRGRILFDEIVTAGKIDKRYIMRSYQVPCIENGLSPIVPLPRLPEKYYAVTVDKEGIELIKKRIDEYLYAEYLCVDTAAIDEIENEHRRMAIKNGAFGFRGKRIEFEGRVAQMLCEEKKDFINLNDVCNLLLKTAVCFINTKSLDAEKSYLQLMQFLMIQGFAEGSSFGSHMILDYGLRTVYVSIMLMRKVLEQNKLIEPIKKAMRWFLHIDAFGFTDGVEERKATADDFYNIVQGILFYVLLLDEQQEQSRYMAAYSDWIDRNLKCTDGLQGMLKDDGCIFHHHGHYIAYGQCALNGVAPVLYALSGTAFDVSEQSWHNVKKVFSALRFQCRDDVIPVAFSGRHPAENQKLQKRPFKYFALSAMERMDREVCAFYIGLKGFPDDELDKRIFSVTKERNVPIVGNNTYPLACATVHRRDNWLAVAKGFSRYLWGSEIYAHDNLYGRYRSYGVLELLTDASPFAQEGYDWNRFPGATTIHLPFHELKAVINKVDEQSGYEEMLLSDQSFAGGLSLNDNGMFSMILTEHPKYNGTFMAMKSIFFYDDFILCIGSGIKNKSGYLTETTLYQNSLDAGGICPLLNGKELNGEHIIEQSDVLSDVHGNFYYLKDGTKINADCALQSSPLSNGGGAAEGLFATCVICHGKYPENATYEYAIGVKGAERSLYHVLQQDEAAHIVQIENITYYSVFEPIKCSLVKSNVPIMLMMEEKNDCYIIGVCNPDLGLYASDESQYDESGCRNEVSVYSRKWLNNPVAERHVEIKFNKPPLLISAALKGGKSYRIKIEKSEFENNDEIKEINSV